MGSGSGLGGLDVLSSIEDVQRRYVILAMAPVLAVGVATPAVQAEFQNRVLRIAPRP